MATGRVFRTPRPPQPSIRAVVVPIPPNAPAELDLPHGETVGDGPDADLCYLWTEARERQPGAQLGVGQPLLRREPRFRYD
jgi:hypothetical protein